MVQERSPNQVEEGQTSVQEDLSQSEDQEMEMMLPSFTRLALISGVLALIVRTLLMGPDPIKLPEEEILVIMNVLK
jgi:hypothetical protein